MRLRQIVVRLAILLGPPVALCTYLILAGRIRENDFPSWAVQAIAGYFVFSIAASALFVRRKAKDAPASDQVPMVQAQARKLWMVMLVLYIQALLAGSFLLLILGQVIYWPFGVLALIINVIFVIILWRLLSRHEPPKN